MKLITFPKNEWIDVKYRLDNGQVVYTIRVDNEYGKYKPGDILKTEWGFEVKILSVKKITGGIDELKNKYEFFSELTKKMVQELSSYDKMEIISLKATSKN